MKKKKDYVVRSVTLPPDVEKKIKEIALKEMRSFNKQVTTLLSEALITRKGGLTQCE